MASNRVLSVDRRLIDCGMDSHWAICIDYQANVDGNKASASRKGRIDYRELLPSNEFALFAQLRDLRQATAARESVPVYTIFTNEQLAAMVQRCVRMPTELASIPGVGEAKTKKYGDAFLEVLRNTQEKADDAP